MRKAGPYLVPAIVIGLVAANPAHGAEVYDAPPILKQNVACMLNVLKSARGYTSPTLGYINSDGWYHPYVQYEYTEKSGWKLTIRFEAAKWERVAGEPERYLFTAHLPGIRAANERNADWGTDAITVEWHTKCAVDSAVTVG